MSKNVVLQISHTTGRMERHDSTHSNDGYGSPYREEEPEWMSYGPNSQSETIELGGTI